MAFSALVATGHGYEISERGRCEAFDPYEILANPLGGFDAADRERRVFYSEGGKPGSGVDYGSHAYYLLQSQESMIAKGRAMETLWQSIIGAQGSLERMETRRRASAQRARRMIAAERAKRLSHQRVIETEAQRMVDEARANTGIARKDEQDARQAMRAAQAELARLKRDMADPTQPERASDIARLVRERDEARTANAALQARAERAEASVLKGAEAIEALASRVAVAEAKLRQMTAAA